MCKHRRRFSTFALTVRVAVVRPSGAPPPHKPGATLSVTATAR
jgi:hypothetical protein